jgi:trk system potassium uptake protein TrkA
MRIVTFGAGTVGTWIADLLCRQRHSVTVVDSDPEQVQRINEELDVRAITGSASQSSVLFQAGVIGADVCLAMTGNDEVNLVAASMAKAMGARRSIARVYAPVFRDLSTFDYQRHFGIDRLLSPEHLTATELARHIRNPGSVLMENFARGEIEVREAIVSEQCTVANRRLSELGLAKGVRIGSIYRDGKMWIAKADDKLVVDDRVTILGKSNAVDTALRLFRGRPGPTKRVVIAGGGETGYHLARILENHRYDVKLMEESPERCEVLSRTLDNTTVINADATRRSILEEERVGSADYFVACTGDDENNIMAGVEAREIGSDKILALVGRPDYAGIVNKLGIDVAVSERDVMARQVLSFLNTGPVISKTSVPGGRISLFEIEVLEGAAATKHVLANVPLPAGCLISAVIRKDFVQVPGADDRLEAGDIIVALFDDTVADEALQQFRVSGR